MHFWHPIGFLDPKYIILGATKSFKVTMGNIPHVRGHRNEWCIQIGPQITNFSGEGTEYCLLLRQIGYPDPHNLDFVSLNASLDFWETFAVA